MLISGYCHNNGKCIDLINDYACDCQEGFSGSKCEINIFDCALEPCLNGGICFDQINVSFPEIKISNPIKTHF